MIRAALTLYRLRRNGIKIPRIALQEARRAGLELAVLCAVLEQETGGGRNVFARYDAYRFETGRVTRRKYRRYKRERDRFAPDNRRMQGVGPMQLTWWSYQDMADLRGGCWKPRYNVRVGAEILALGIRVTNLHRALWRYNGRRKYADEVMLRVAKWRHILPVARLGRQ